MGVTRLVLAVSLSLAAACASTTSAPSSSTVPAADTTGKFIWHDLVTDDATAARRFYSEVLGWEFSDVTRRNRPYVIARAHGRMVAGLVAVDPVARQEVSQWVGYQSVASVDHAVAGVEKAGGRTLVAPVNVSVGRAAVVSDPQGAPFGLLRLSGPDPVDDRTPVEGTFFWMEYLARDAEAAVAFYTGTFGYQRRVTDRLGTTEYTVLSRGRPRGGILPAPRPEMRSTWLPYVLVTDPAPLVTKVRAAGGSVLLEPRADVRNGSLAVVTDPSGAMLALQRFPF